MARASMERQVNGAMKDKSIFRDEEGSTTAGMAVALLVTLSLLFSAAQVYRIHAAGAEVQEVADAAACAALNLSLIHICIPLALGTPVRSRMRLHDGRREERNRTFPRHFYGRDLA